MPTPQATHAKMLAFQICPAWQVGVGRSKHAEEPVALLNLPTGHAAQPAAVTVALYVFTSQGVHALAPAEDHEPDEQSMQVLMFVAPVLLEYLPVAHGIQPITSFCWSYMTR